MAEPKAWITVNGNHVPIMEGQSKDEAVKSFIDSKTKSHISDNKKNGEKQKESGESSNSLEKLLIDKYGEYAPYLADIERYVGTLDVESDSHSINKYLSNAKALGIDPTASKTSNNASTVRQMDKAMNISPLEKDMTLYRGVSADDYFRKFKVGDVVDMNGRYTSTSTNERIANGFKGHNGENYMLKINAPKGTPSINVAKAFNKRNNPSASNEGERILSRNLKYKVVSIDGDVITLDVVNG